jgi:hypothetical protein
MYSPPAPQARSAIGDRRDDDDVPALDVARRLLRDKAIGVVGFAEATGPRAVNCRIHRR